MTKTHSRNRIAVISAITLMLAFGLTSIVYANAVVGSVTAVSGKASVQRAGATLDAALNMPIELHDRLATGPDGRLSVMLSDTAKTKINLPRQSTIDIDEMTIVASGAPSSTTVN